MNRFMRRSALSEYRSGHIVQSATLVLGACVVLIALAGFIAWRFEISTDVMDFVPQGSDAAAEGIDLAKLSSDISQSPLARTMTLALSASAESGIDLAEVSRQFEHALLSDEDARAAIAVLQGAPQEGIERAAWDVYSQHIPSLLASSTESARMMLTDEGLHAAAAHLKSELSGPMSSMIAQLAPRDPFLVLPSLFRRMAHQGGEQIQIKDGRFFSGQHALLFVQTKASAFDAKAQAPLLERIQEQFANLNTRHGGALSLQQSSIHRFTVRMAEAIESDIKRVTILSISLLVLLLLLMFRSLHGVILIAFPMLGGLLTAGAVVLAVFGRIHGITVAFGASLIGVCIDYVVHLYCHHAMVPSAQGPRESLRAIFPALLTGALTTLTGFLALAASSLAGLREVALFASAGIVGAFLITWIVLPSLLPKSIAATRSRQALATGLSALMHAIERGRHHMIWLLALVALLCVFGFQKVHFRSAMTDMAQLSPELVAEDEAVRAMTQVEQSRFIIAMAKSDDEALRINEQVAKALEHSIADGELRSFRSLAPLLPSPKSQQSIVALLRDPSFDVQARMRAAFTEHGFTPDAFEPFYSMLEQPPGPPLGYADLARSPLDSLVSRFRFESESGTGYLTFLHGIEDHKALEHRIAAVPGAAFVDQTTLMKRSYQAYLGATLRYLALGFVAVLMVLLVRYRNFRRALAAFVPSVLAVGITIAALGFAGYGIDLVVLTALLFVVSIGVDYGVFLVDADEHASVEARNAALSSIAIAGISTIIGFGALAFSEHPVLASLGITAAVGITSNMILTPTALVFLKKRRSVS